MNTITQFDSQPRHIKLTSLYDYNYEKPKQLNKTINNKQSQQYVSTDECIEYKLNFLDLLISKDIIELLDHIEYHHLGIAEISFNILKKNWPWKREYTFLIPSLADNAEESDYITELGFDC